LSGALDLMLGGGYELQTPSRSRKGSHETAYLVLKAERAPMDENGQRPPYEYLKNGTVENMGSSLYWWGFHRDEHQKATTGNKGASIEFAEHFTEPSSDGEMLVREQHHNTLSTGTTYTKEKSRATVTAKADSFLMTGLTHRYQGPVRITIEVKHARRASPGLN